MKLNQYSLNKTFEYENAYYATATESRFGKFLAHYELYKKIIHIPGSVIECGLFKGNSFFRLSHFRDLLESKYSRKLIGFDVFDSFPDTNFENDKKYLRNFITQAGEISLDIDDMHNVMNYKGIENYDLVKGDIRETVPKYCLDNPHLKIALLHIDTDVYEPAVTILENMYDKVVQGGIIMFDDYGTFPGETRAVDEFLKNKNLNLHKLPLSHVPSFIVKK